MTTGSRKRPNILITGTPGTGKTELCSRLTNATSMKHINIGRVAEENNCYDGDDPTFQCKILDEDKVIECIESQMIKGNNIVDYHGSDFFEEDWFDIIFCLRTDIEILSKRLEERGYSEIKIKNNVESEIFQVLLEEARESYNPDIIYELSSNNLADIDSNIQRIVDWLKAWEGDNEIPQQSDVER